MIEGAFSAADALSDAFLSLGLAVCFSFFYQLFFARPLRAKVLNFASHILFFALAGVFVFCFIAGTARAREPRWYLFAGGAAGVFAYRSCFSRAVGAALKAIGRILGKLTAPVTRAMDCARAHLQKRLAKVYNRLAEKKRNKTRAKEQSDGLEGEGRRGKKEPLKPYVQT